MTDKEQASQSEKSPDDFCRTCGGTGSISEPDYRQGVGMVTVHSRCWVCRGSGTGR